MYNIGSGWYVGLIMVRSECKSYGIVLRLRALRAGSIQLQCQVNGWGDVM